MPALGVPNPTAFPVSKTLTVLIKALTFTKSDHKIHLRFNLKTDRSLLALTFTLSARTSQNPYILNWTVYEIAPNNVG